MTLVMTLLQLIQLTGFFTVKPITVRGDLCETFNISVPTDLSQAEAHEVLLSALESHHYALLPGKVGFFIANARILDFDTFDRPGCRPAFSDVKTVLWRVDGSLSDAQKKMKSRLSKNGIISTVPSTNAIVFSDGKEEF